MTASVVLAAYNGEPFIKEQLLSILQGTRPPDEIIVVDDASTDGTVHVVEEVASRFSQYRWLLIRNATNMGVTSSFLKGCEHVRCDIVFFSDQDDRWYPEKVERLADVLQDDPGVTMVYSDGLITGPDLEPTGRTIFSTRSKAHLALGMERPMMEVASNPDIKGCTMAVRTDLLLRIRGLEQPGAIGRYWGHDHWIALMAHGLGRVVALNEPLLLHRFHGGNTSAGAGFRWYSLADWRKWTKAAKWQAPDHFLQRYRSALNAVGQLGPSFRTELKEALVEMHRISDQRARLHLLPTIQRIGPAWRLHAHGVYAKHYNGALTLLRDILL